VKLLADTSALLALMWRDDQNHAAAATFVQENPQARFLLTDLVLSELATRLRAKSSAERAASAVGNLLESRRYELVFVDAEAVRGALAYMRRFADKRLSFADCASFEVMDRLRLDAAFTFARDFRDCGFRMVPRPSLLRG
jgi:predicted nucleic acid-binding protein